MLYSPTLSDEPIGPLLEWRLPSHGTALVECGKLGFRGHQTLDGECHYRAFKVDCARFECPVCTGWVSREAAVIEKRVLAGMPAHRPPVHVILSPPPASPPVRISEYRDLRQRAYRVARSRGLAGGCLVFHPLRIAKAGVRDRCEDGPHFHFIGEGLKHDLEDGFRADGWVVKFLGSRKRVRRTATYILSHAGQAHRAAPALEGPTETRSPLEVVTWFGSMAYNRLNVPDLGSEGVYCVLCGVSIPLTEWFRLTWEGVGPPPTDSGVLDSALWRAELSTPDRTGGYSVRVALELPPTEPPYVAPPPACVYCLSRSLPCVHLD